MIAITPLATSTIEPYAKYVTIFFAQWWGSVAEAAVKAPMESAPYRYEHIHVTRQRAKLGSALDWTERVLHQPGGA